MPSERVVRLLDRGERLDAIGGVWPDFPHLVTTRFTKVWDGTDYHKRRASGRHRGFRSRAYPDVPAARFLGWEHEQLEVALQETLNDLPSVLWRRGERHPGTVESLVQRVLPPVRLHISLELSRTTRPGLPLPHDCERATKEIEPIRESSCFDGWFRIGWCERELTQGGIAGREPVRMIAVMMGVAPSEVARGLANSVTPIIPARVASSWLGGHSGAPVVLSRLHQPLVGYGRPEGLLGGPVILGLCPAAVAACGLSPSPWPGPLCLRDAVGAPALALRYWREEPLVGDLAGATHRLEGCDLLASAKAVQELSGAVVSALLQITEVLDDTPRKPTVEG